MTYSAALQELVLHFEEQWAIRAHGVRVSRRNGPKLAPAPDPKSDAYVVVNDLPVGAKHDVIGHRERMMYTRFRVQIFTPLGLGDGRSRALGDQVADLWDTAHANGLDKAITMEEPQFVPGGRVASSLFWMDTVSTRYHHWLSC